jgi:hypothetical protein
MSIYPEKYFVKSAVAKAFLADLDKLLCRES